MTTYSRDGERFEVNGIEFEAVEDRENHYRGFRCTVCNESFTHDPSDHLHPEQRDAVAFAADLRTLAEMVEGNPELVPLLWTVATPNVPVSAGDVPVVDVMARMVRIGLAAKCKIEKSFDHWANVDLALPAGAITLHVYADREEVCTRRVVGTREVEREVPACPVCHAPLSTSESGRQFCDAGHFAASSTTVTQTVEVAGHDCHPLLAESQS